MKAMKAIFALFVLVMLAAMALGVPYGPDSVNKVSDERADFSGVSAKQLDAQAGNVTQLELNVSMITNRWQGYYGNISGKITLDDGSSNTMYDWSGNDGAFSPVGEIYAANQSIVSWNDIICVNFTGNGTPGQEGINLTVLETLYGMSPGDGDGIDETFIGLGSILVGTKPLTNCPATHIYQNNASQIAYWNETLLTENSTSAVIFATQVNQNTIGFDGSVWDFQMIVGENGDIAAVTPYYFYVELA